MTDVIWIMIQGDDQFALKCLLKLWEMQTEAEQDIWQTLEQNLHGFTSGDALGMSKWAETVSRHGTLTVHEMQQVRKRLLKYCGQLSTYKEITEDLV